MGVWADGWAEEWVDGVMYGWVCGMGGWCDGFKGWFH